MAHCEKPGCTQVAGDVKVVTPYGEPVVCDDDALALQLLERSWRRLTVGQSIKTAWLLRAMRTGPESWEARRRWLEGLPIA